MRGVVTTSDELPARDWAVIRPEYEGDGGTLEEIAARHHTSVRTLLRHAKEEGWLPRSAKRRVDRSAIIVRMFRVLERQIIFLDKDMKQSGEKEAAVLGKLASTLEKLIDIDNAASPGTPAVQQHDMKELRHKLARRIAQLRAG
jgi:hypothetical protein